LQGSEGEGGGGVTHWGGGGRERRGRCASAPSEHLYYYERPEEYQKKEKEKAPAGVAGRVKRERVREREKERERERLVGVHADGSRDAGECSPGSSAGELGLEASSRATQITGGGRSDSEGRESRGVVHTDGSMWKNYGYWMQEVAPQYELTMKHQYQLNMKHSQKKKQALGVVCGEGVSPLARGIIWPLAIGNKLQLTRDLFAILKSKARAARACVRAQHTRAGVDGADVPAASFGLEGSARLIETDLSRTMASLGLFDATGDAC
jgi:hypothetical protein